MLLVQWPGSYKNITRKITLTPKAKGKKTLLLQPPLYQFVKMAFVLHGASFSILVKGATIIATWGTKHR